MINLDPNKVNTSPLGDLSSTPSVGGVTIPEPIEPVAPQAPVEPMVEPVVEPTVEPTAVVEPVTGPSTFISEEPTAPEVVAEPTVSPVDPLSTSFGQGIGAAAPGGFSEPKVEEEPIITEPVGTIGGTTKI